MNYELRAAGAHVSNMDDIVADLDFDKDEYIDSDPTERAWAADKAELDDRWRKRIKNQVLGLKLAEKPLEEIAPTLVKRYENQLNRLSQYNEQDVFAVYANALTSQFDPHTNYFSPRRAENFDIDMRLSLEGLVLYFKTRTNTSRLCAWSQRVLQINKAT